MNKDIVDQKKSRIVLLGTGNPNADPERSGPSVAIVVGEMSYIVDFGPGVVRRASAAYQAGIKALTAGYPDLILTPWVLGRDEPLEVYGPRGIKEMTEHILAAYQEDINERINGLQPSNDIGYKVNTHEIEPGVVYQDQDVTLEAFRVNHGSLQAFGYKFHTPDRMITISGDTAPFESCVEKYYGSDVLIHEVY